MNIFKHRSEFISRFLYRVKDDEFYWVSGAPPTEELIAQASAATNDILSFEAHSAAFATLAEVIDVCTAEELESKGSGIAARNATKHPSVIALTKLEFERRAGIAAAAAQGLVWMDVCGQWVNDTTLRNQIAKRVMTAVLLAVGRIKQGYSSAQLAALTRLGVVLQNSDGFALRARGAIVEIIAGNISQLPNDSETLTILRELLDVIAARSIAHAQPTLKAADKLKSLTLNEQAT